MENLQEINLLDLKKDSIYYCVTDPLIPLKFTGQYDCITCDFDTWQVGVFTPVKTAKNANWIEYCPDKFYKSNVYIKLN